METLISVLITLLIPVGFDPVQAISRVKGEETNSSNNIAKGNDNNK